jgi:SAM-dependent methyltransferase
MIPTVLRTNATAVYRFLGLMHARLEEGETLRGKRILDCGAGGPVPPLAIFAEQGMEAVGIDISEPQLERVRAFVERTGLRIELRQADMRCLPFADASFDYVYEHYSMCHLNVEDTARTIAEMRRVLVPGGLAFLGVVSSESWPLSAYGEERSPGEYWMVENGEQILHCLLSDKTSDNLVTGWEIVSKEKAVFHVGGDSVSEADWANLHEEAPVPCSPEDWAAQYDLRTNYYRYVHTYYVLRKPAN